MYWQAVDKNNPKGKTRFFESYRNPQTGVLRTVSVTLDKNTTQSRKTALNVLHGRVAAILSELSPSENAEMTLSELISRYNLDQEQDLTIRESTWTRNHRQMKAVQRILGADVQVNKLTAAYVNDCFRNCGESNGTINERIVRMKAMLRWANQNGYLKDVSWLSGIKTYHSTESKEKLLEKFMDSEELARLLASMKVKKWKMVTEFLALSGLRIGEFIALNRSDVSIDNENPIENVIRVTKTYYVNGSTVTQNTKTDASTREVFIQSELKEVIARIEEWRTAQDLTACEIFFPNEKSGYMSYHAYNKYLRENTENILGRKLTAHALRHTHTSLLAEKGIPLETISRRLGHGDSEITKQVYLHVTKNMEEADRKLLESVRLLT